MTTKEMRQALREDVMAKYARFKHEATVAHHNGEISDDDLRMRKKFLTREASICIERINKASSTKIEELYTKKFKNKK